MFLFQGEKPFPCPHCTYRASLKGNLTKHIRKVHRQYVPSQQLRVKRNCTDKSKSAIKSVKCFAKNPEVRGQVSRVEQHFLTSTQVLPDRGTLQVEAVSRTQSTLQDTSTLDEDEGCSSTYIFEKHWNEEGVSTDGGSVLTVDSESHCTAAEVAMTLAQLAQRNSAQNNSDVLGTGQENIIIVIK